MTTTAFTVVALVAVSPLLLTLLQSGRGRAILIVVGGVVVFQSSESLSSIKVGYMAVVLAAVATSRRERECAPLRRAEAAGLILAICVTLSCVVALLRGAELPGLLRDAAPYLLLAASARLAADLGRRSPPRSLLNFATTAGVIGAALWTAEWMSRRGYVEAVAPGLASFSLVCLGVALTSARAATSRSSSSWWMLTGTLIAAALATGTRNALLLLIIPAVVTFVSGRDGSRQRRMRVLIQALIVLPIGMVMLVAAAWVADVDLTSGYSRVGGLLAADGGVSLAERRVQHDLAATEFVRNPLIGNPGKTYDVYRPSSWRFTRQSTLDSSLLPLARWGVVGTVSLAWFLWRWWRFLRPAATRHTVWGLAASGFLAACLPQLIAGPLVEDKGFGLSLLLLGAGSLSARVNPGRSSRSALAER